MTLLFAAVLYVWRHRIAPPTGPGMPDWWTDRRYVAVTELWWEVWEHLPSTGPVHAIVPSIEILSDAAVIALLKSLHREWKEMTYAVL